MRLRELQPGLWLTELVLDEFDVRGAVLLGRRDALVWDTLSHPRDMAGVAPLLGGRPLTVVYSHADWDHVWGTQGLPVGEVVGHATCRARFEDDVPETLARRQADQPGQWDDVGLVPPTRTFDEEATLDLGDLTLVVHHLPGHTRDCCVGFIPERGVLLMGDTVETPLPVVNDATVLDGWLARLCAWRDDPRVRTVIPAHGPIGGREIIANNVTYLAALRAGGSPQVPDDLTAFYFETHRENLRLARERGPGDPLREPDPGTTGPT